MPEHCEFAVMIFIFYSSEAFIPCIYPGFGYILGIKKNSVLFWCALNPVTIVVQSHTKEIRSTFVSIDLLCNIKQHSLIKNLQKNSLLK